MQRNLFTFIDQVGLVSYLLINMNFPEGAIIWQIYAGSSQVLVISLCANSVQTVETSSALTGIMKGKVTIIGSGLVGKSWAVIFSKAGYNVTLYDTSKPQLDAALLSINNQLVEFEKQGLLTGCIKSSAEAFKLVSTCEDLAKALDGATFVQVGVGILDHVEFCGS